MEPFQNNDSRFAMAEKYRLVATEMRKTVVYLESALGPVKVDKLFHSRRLCLLFFF